VSFNPVQGCCSSAHDYSKDAGFSFPPTSFEQTLAFETVSSFRSALPSNPFWPPQADGEMTTVQRRQIYSEADRSTAGHFSPEENHSMVGWASSQLDQSMPDRSTTPHDPNIDCPWYNAAMAKNRPRTCRNPKLKDMAAVRRHIMRDRPPHLPFLKQCLHCKRLFLIQRVFERQHGYKGEICRDEPIENDLDAQWKQLYQIAREVLDNVDGSDHLSEY
jgi:hypothetical protein